MSYFHLHFRGPYNSAESGRFILCLKFFYLTNIILVLMNIVASFGAYLVCADTEQIPFSSFHFMWLDPEMTEILTLI